MDEELFRKIEKIEKDIDEVLRMLNELNKYLIENLAMIKDMIDAIEAELTTDTSGRYEKKEVRNDV